MSAVLGPCILSPPSPSVVIVTSLSSSPAGVQAGEGSGPIRQRHVSGVPRLHPLDVSHDVVMSCDHAALISCVTFILNSLFHLLTAVTNSSTRDAQQEGEGPDDISSLISHWSVKVSVLILTCR